MKVGELISKLQKFDPQMEVGGCGHFGEILEVYEPYIQQKASMNESEFVCLEIEDAGQEPD